MPTPFVHLHTHSHYSLLDGLTRVDQLVNRAKELGMTALALTDHGSMYGLVEFYQLCRKAGIKPILGQEAYLALNGHTDKRGKVDEDYRHLILLVRDATGYHNLLKLTSIAHLQGFYYKPRIDWALLEQYHDGLIALSGCLNGPLSPALRSGNDAEAKAIAQRLQAIFGKGNFYLEAQHHPTLPGQQQVNDGLRRLSADLGIPAVATQDSHYLDHQDAEAQDILLALQAKKRQSDTDRLSFIGEDLSFASGDEMAAKFADWPEAIASTLLVAERCDFALELGRISLPYYALPPGETDYQVYLAKLCQGHLPRRYPPERQTAAQARLDYELSVIGKTGFASYFLIVQDFVNWAKGQGIVVGPGRGSAAGSIVSYLLNITTVEPIRYELLFERFLNPERISMPDIDLDFADARRDEVIRYVEQKYGRDHVCQIGTFGTMAARAAVRDVGRVLGYSYSFCDRVAKLIPMFESLAEAISSTQELRELYQRDPEAQKLIDTARKLEGVARHVSTHACGVLITKEPLDTVVPLQYASAGDQTVISQYSLHPIEDLGLLKIDFLGLRNLTILETAAKLVRQTRGVSLALDDLPLDDPATFKLLQAGDTTGVFQLESSGMRRYLKQLQPTALEDLIAMVSLYRPGPMEFIEDFIAGKAGKRKPRYLHPKLEPILSRTYGIAVYQEQIMQIARDLAGFSLAQADVLRKAVGKKIKKLLDEQAGKMIQGMTANGIQPATAQKIWDFILPFARYGFNRAHAACYALIAYQTAYLKANYPAEFMAALLTATQDSTDRLAVQIAECQQNGLPVLPPEVNESLASFTVIPGSTPGQGDRIRFGLAAVKNVGTGLVDAIIAERQANGPYAHLADLLNRLADVELNRKSLECLIRAGALEPFGERQQLLQGIDTLISYWKRQQQAKRQGQSSLFSSASGVPTPAQPLRLPAVPPADQRTRLQWERELLGLYISDHPFRDAASRLPADVVRLHDLRERAAGADQTGELVKTAGLVSRVQKVTTRAGEPMLFLTLEDDRASIEAIVFPKLYREQPGLWEAERLLIVEGKLSEKDGLPKLLVERARTLDQSGTAAARPTATGQPAPGTVRLILPDAPSAALLQRLKQLLLQHPGDQPVLLQMGGPRPQTIRATVTVEWSEMLAQELSERCPEVRVEVVA